MDDSDSDDIPLTKYSSKSKNITIVDDSDDDDLPDWVKQYKSPAAPAPRRQLSDSDDSSGAEPHKKELPSPSPPRKLSAEDKPAASARTEPAPKQEASQATDPGPPSQDDELPSQAAAVKHGVQGIIPPAVANLPGEVSLMLPEKLHRNKILIEIASTEDNPATDLAGDAGAVGRVIVVGAGKSGHDESELHLDLKGVLYKAEILPLAGCAMVFNIGTTDAKVESMVSDYVRLRPESAYELMGSEVEGADLMMDDDEDNYQLEDDDADAGDDGGKAKKGGKVGKDKAAAKKPAAKKPAPKKPAAKKPAAKHKALPKGVTKKTGKEK